LEALGINLGYLLVQLLNFIIMFIVLKAWVVTPVMGMLDKRNKTIAQGLEDARIASEARSNAEREAKGIIEKAQIDAAQVIRDTNDRAEKMKVDLRAAAENDISKLRADSLKEITLERNRLLAEVRGQVATLSIAGAQKLIGESLISDEKRQHALLDELFSGVKAGSVVVLEGTDISGDHAEITSALPLTDEEQQVVKKDMLGKLSPGAQIDFRVDPSILGGLVVRVGNRIVDRSVAGQLQELQQSLT